MKKQYNIMTSCDDNLVPYTAVGLTAMAHNLPDAEIDFYFFHSRVSRENIELLDALCGELGKEHIRFHEIFVPQAEVYDELAAYGTGWAGEAYYSLCAHQLLPKQADRVLYLDAGDTLVLDDISPFYDYDFQGNSLAATVSSYKTLMGVPVLFRAGDLADRDQMLPAILRGIFNSGSYMMNLNKMREDERSLADYQYLLQVLRQLLGEERRDIYWGDQGLLSAAFVGDIRYYDYPQIKDLWHMPYNFCLWYYDTKTERPDYDPKILHFAGTAFKPWEGAYPVFLERFQKKERLRSLKELKNGQAEYYYLWHEYAILTDRILEKMGSRGFTPSSI